MNGMGVDQCVCQCGCEGLSAGGRGRLNRGSCGWEED